MKKYNTDSFIENAIIIHGNDNYDYSKVIYKNSQTKVKINCKIHGLFEQSPTKHLSGQGCKLCGYIRTINLKRGNKEEFIVRAKKIHGEGKYDYSNVDYKSRNDKVKIICNIHKNEFLQSPWHHLEGKTGCGKCSGADKQITTEKIINQFKKIHGNKYDYSTTVYNGTYTEVIIICPDHGEFKQTPKKHKVGQGCSICSGCDKHITTEKIIKRFKLVHGNKYDYSFVEYKKLNDKVTIICPDHEKFEQTPCNHLAGKGCNKCMYCPNCYLYRTLGRLCCFCKPRENNKQYKKTKEYKVVDYMRNNINKEFVHNKSVGNDCTKNDRKNTNGHLFPDLRWDCGWFHLILEVDEFQHRGSDYKCDERRMVDVIAKLGMPCVFIRYNPDNNESCIEKLKNKVEEYLHYEKNINSLDFGHFGRPIVEYLYYK